MVTISLAEDEAQRFLQWLVQVQAAWLVTNPVVIQLASQLQQGRDAMAVQAKAMADGAERVAG